MTATRVSACTSPSIFSSSLGDRGPVELLCLALARNKGPPMCLATNVPGGSERATLKNGDPQKSRQIHHRLEATPR